MTRTCLRHKVSALAVVTLIFIFASSPAWAPAPVCPNCIVHSDKFTVGITPSEIVRVCLVGVVTTPASAAIDWEIGFFDAVGGTVLVKQVEVPQQDFGCIDTTAEELRLAGLEPEPSGRLQFGLRITPQEPVPLLPQPQPEKLTMNGNVYHSVETINMLSQATTSSHRFAHPDFAWLPVSTRGASSERRLP